MFDSCQGDLWLFNQDKLDYKVNWTSWSNNSQTENHSDSIIDSFKYKSSIELDSYPYSGLYTDYFGGGYVHRIVLNDFDQIKLNLQTLQNLTWLDKYTRSLFIEFTLYNPNVNLFSYNIILFEFLPTGNLLNSFRFEPVSLSKLWDLTFVYSTSVFISILNLIYFIFTILFILNQVNRLNKLNWNFKKYILKIWNLIDLCLIVFSLSALSIHLFKVTYSTRIFQMLKYLSKEKFINLQNFSYLNQVYYICIGFCTTFGTIRMLKLLRFNKQIYIFMNLFKKCFQEIISFMAVFSIIWFSFVHIIHLFLSQNSLKYASFYKSMVTCFEMILGKFDLIPMLQVNPSIGMILYMAYILLVAIFLTNLFVVILDNRLHKIKSEPLKFDKELVFFYIKKKLFNLIEELKEKKK